MDTYVESQTEFMHLNLKKASKGKKPGALDETRLTRSRSDESRSRSPAKRPTRSRSRDGPSPLESRPTKMARTGRSTVTTPSPGRGPTGSMKSSRGATSKRKADVRSKSPTIPKIRRTGRERKGTATLLSPSAQENGRTTSKADKPKRTNTSTTTTARRSIMPFGDVLASSPGSPGTPQAQGKENC